MLSYRHLFHAGNHADILKHLVLVHTCKYMVQKDKPFWYIDTHAGAGSYNLDTPQARQNAEFRDGIGRLWEQESLPPAVADYVQLVRAINPLGTLRQYPGSPWIANHILREEDRLKLFELHSTEQKLLQNAFRSNRRKVVVSGTDGHFGLKALLPPITRRGLVLIDPSYEVQADYFVLVDTLKESLRRFATGTYLVWYPHLSKMESRLLPDKLKALPCKDWLNVSLSVKKPSPDGFGMPGSAMFVINPPWTLAAALEESLPWLTETLAQGDGAQFRIETSAPPAAAKPAG